MKSTRRWCLSTMAALGIWGAVLCAQDQTPVFRASVEAVRLHVRATDGRKALAGLAGDDFEVFDNGVAQRAQLVPLSEGVHVVLVLDVSGSLAGEPLMHLSAAARSLVGALGPTDRCSLLTFSQRLSLPLSRAGDKERMAEVLQPLAASGRTALYDAVYSGLALAETETTGRALLLVFTDGLDNSSWLTLPQVSDALRRSQTVMYSVAPPGLDTPLSPLAPLTGGMAFRANADKWLAGVFVRVLEQFRSGYLLVYTPQGVKRGDGWHAVDVRLRGRKGRVVARPGYYSR